MKYKIYWLILIGFMLAVPAMAFELKNPKDGDSLRIELRGADEQKGPQAFQDYVAELAASARTDQMSAKRAAEESEAARAKEYNPWNPIVLFRW